MGCDDSEVSQYILYFLTLVEVNTADDLVWDIPQYQTLLKHTGLCIGTVEDRKVLIVGIALTYFFIYGINDVLGFVPVTGIGSKGDGCAGFVIGPESL